MHIKLSTFLAVGPTWVRLGATGPDMASGGSRAIFQINLSHSFRLNYYNFQPSVLFKRPDF